MANVLVDDIYLTQIADGIRKARGQTKIIYIPTEVPVDPKKYSSTPNATGFDTYSGGYGNNKSLLDTVTIDGAASLEITVQYQTESTNYDWLYIVEGTVTSMPSSGTKYGGTTKTTKTLSITGDTVTFCFRSDSSNDSYLGYYAEITGLDADGNVIGTGQTEIIDIPTVVPNTFRPSEMGSALEGLSSFSLTSAATGEVMGIPEGTAVSDLALPSDMFASAATGMLPTVYYGVASSVLALASSMFASTAVGEVTE